MGAGYTAQLVSTSRGKSTAIQGSLCRLCIGQLACVACWVLSQASFSPTSYLSSHTILQFHSNHYALLTIFATLPDLALDRRAAPGTTKGESALDRTSRSCRPLRLHHHHTALSQACASDSLRLTATTLPANSKPQRCWFPLFFGDIWAAADTRCSHPPRCCSHGESFYTAPTHKDDQ